MRETPATTRRSGVEGICSTPGDMSALAALLRMRRSAAVNASASSAFATAAAPAAAAAEPEPELSPMLFPLPLALAPVLLLVGGVAGVRGARDARAKGTDVTGGISGASGGRSVKPRPEAIADADAAEAAEEALCAASSLPWSHSASARAACCPAMPPTSAASDRSASDASGGSTAPALGPAALKQ